MKVAFYTLGCKVNTYETEAMMELFEEDGFELVDFESLADVYVINTCTVTNQSDSKSRKIIRKAKKNNDKSCVVVVGCLAKMSQDELKDMQIDVLLGVRNKYKVLDKVKEFLKDNVQILLANEEIKDFDRLKVSEFKKTTRAFLKIQDGCNEFCSYCIIPYARGQIISKPLEDIVSEAKSLIENGYKEIVLSGIHTGKYGIDIGLNLELVIKTLLELEGLYLLRLSSIEINEVTNGIIELMKNDKFAKHLHIPLQNADDIVLKDMNRKYSFDYFKNTMEKIKLEVPGINFTTDYICGYPTESNEQHLNSVEKVKSLPFSKLHVFPFSKRKGTKASELKDLNGLVKDMRVTSFLELSDKLDKSFNDSFLGETVEVLIEQVKDGISIGHTTNFLKVKIKQQLEPNSIYSCVVTSTNDNFVWADKKITN